MWNIAEWIMIEGYRDKPRKWLCFLYRITRPRWIAMVLYLPIQLLRNFEIQYFRELWSIWMAWYFFSDVLDEIKIR